MVAAKIYTHSFYAILMGLKKCRNYLKFEVAKAARSGRHKSIWTLDGSKKYRKYLSPFFLKKKYLKIKRGGGKVPYTGICMENFQGLCTGVKCKQNNILDQVFLAQCLMSLHITRPPPQKHICPERDPSRTNIIGSCFPRNDVEKA